ncbi:ABC transporter permease [Rhodobacteraceae bacterium XHP0102]|nr:ABC transporter permease [Rhodobacteraceae bacterium XHP0102]
MLRLEKRPQPSRGWTYGAPVLAVFLTIVLGMGLFALLGKDPLVAIRTIFWDPIFGPFAHFYRPEIIKKAAPLVLIAVGLSFGFRAGIWNIGAEGQYIIGAICGAAVALAFYPMDARWLIFPLMIAAGVLGGFLWAMIPALLRVRFNTNEILVSLMLVYVADVLIKAFSIGVLRNPEGFGMPGSRNLRQYPSAANLDLIPNSGLHWGSLVALFAVIFAYILFTRHHFGFQVRLAGQSPRAARFAGINANRLVILCLGISGALAGVAGMFQVAGPSGQILGSFPSFYGFTAIIVAFLGRLHPVGILCAGLIMALTYIGGQAAEAQLNLPAAAILTFQGMLLFCLLAVDVLTNYRFRLGQGEAR